MKKVGRKRLCTFLLLSVAMLVLMWVDTPELADLRKRWGVVYAFWLAWLVSVVLALEVLTRATGNED